MKNQQAVDQASLDQAEANTEAEKKKMLQSQVDALKQQQSDLEAQQKLLMDISNS